MVVGPGPLSRTGPYWATADQQPEATEAEKNFAWNWRDTPKVVFSSTLEVGHGTPFFTTPSGRVNLELVETRTFPGGVILARYKARR